MTVKLQLIMKSLAKKKQATEINYQEENWPEEEIQ